MAPEKTFIAHFPVQDVGRFRAAAEKLVPLQKHGRVLVNVSALAEKSRHEMPEGGCPWREYANYNPTPFKFFPHPIIAPHIPEDHVARNRELLLAKAEVIRELGMGASFWSYEPNYLPESFFEDHPHLRGPRVDHPRRSRQEAFAICVDLEESQEIISWMIAELKRNVPELACYSFKSNDAGAGLCWAAAQYSGPNGPQHCRGRTAGERVRDLVDAIHRGAVEGGGPIDVRIGHTNFWQNEMDVVHAKLPENTYLAGRDASTMHAGSLISSQYPVLGMVDPLSIVASMERFSKPETKTSFLDFRSSYDRAAETPDTIERVVEVIADCIESPASGFMGRIGKLQELAARWGGDQHRDALVEGFYKLNEALRLKGQVAGAFRSMYSGLSMRYINRPLVIRPDLLTEEEEQDFLPHVFNIHEDEGRMDYIDLHGGRMQVAPGGAGRTSIPGLQHALRTARSVAGTLESAADGPAGEWLGGLATSIRIWTSLVRSANNFYFAQIIRDRNAEALRGDPLLPRKVADWSGHPDFIPFNEIMRDELDNANELIALLKNGGLARVAQSADARGEDTFLLGPNLVEQLERKIATMRRHWRDIERYLASPHK